MINKTDFLSFELKKVLNGSKNSEETRRFLLHFSNQGIFLEQSGLERKRPVHFRSNCPLPIKKSPDSL
ncbi:MAG: hypothetical protein Q4C95_12205 [Planctomycetia bacterium]|nr:hypothetical protein [Planctomycetia bacterium]